MVHVHGDVRQGFFLSFFFFDPRNILNLERMKFFFSFLVIIIDFYFILSYIHFIWTYHSMETPKKKD
jgi:hypothetical protein